MRESTKIKVAHFKKLIELDIEFFSRYALKYNIDAEFRKRHAAFQENYLAKEIATNGNIANTVKEFSNDILLIWNESINIITEFFWISIDESNLNYKRKDTIGKIIEKRRFPNCYLHREARYNWTELIKSKLLENRFSKDQIETFEQIIEQDELKRLNLLKKCLRNNRVASSSYLRYGDAIAYFTNGKLIEDTRNEKTLLDHYFTKEEIETLQSIWH